MSASQPNEPTATGTLAVTVFVCTSCRRAAPTGAIERPGGDLVGELSRRFRAAGAEDVMVTGVECLAVCKRPCTVAVTAASRYLPAARAGTGTAGNSGDERHREGEWAEGQIA